MAQANRKERKAKAEQVRSKISTMISGIVYEARRGNETVSDAMVMINKFVYVRSKQDPGNAHMYRTVSKKVIAQISA